MAIGMEQDLEYLVLAPHASFPPHDGASLRSIELARQLLAQGHGVRLVAKDRDYSSLEEFDAAGSSKGERSKWAAAAWGLASGRGYHSAKHVTGEWLKRARLALRRLNPRFVHIHFLYTANRLDRELKGRRLLIDTHNYDPEVYRNLMERSRNPLLRLLGKFSLRECLHAADALGAGQEWVHVTDGDAARYRRIAPEGCHVVVPNGCAIRPRSVVPDYGELPKSIYFLGLLSATMNVDALRFFAASIWPAISGVARMHVFGRHPGSELVALCRDWGWELVPDVSEGSLAERVEGMHYAVLPFNYAAGSKLKLLDACGRGVPVLATQDGARGHDRLPQAVHVLDEPWQWKQLLCSGEAPRPCQVSELVEYAMQYSWDVLASNLHRIAEERVWR